MTKPQAPSKKKHKTPKAVKLVVTILVIAVIAAVTGALIYFFLIREENTAGVPMTGVVTRSSIQSVVEGTGVIKPSNSSTVTPAASGTLLELMVAEGDTVTAGQQLFRMDDSEAQDTLLDAQKDVSNCQKEVKAIQDKIQYLTITAPHAGNLREVADLRIGDTVTEGTKIATLVDDTRLLLSLYYSYTYENSFAVGQTAEISLPATMGTVTGTVEKINKVRFISPEGATHFEVVFVIRNSGALVEGMTASASLTAKDGTAIYPYASGTLTFYESTTITAKATGPLEEYHLLNYADVQAGQLLVRLGEDDNDTELASKQTALKNAQNKLEEAVEQLAKYNATAPIDGTVLSCNLVAGETVESGWAITIADTTTMKVEIQVDERNIRYVTPGMIVDITQDNGMYYMGLVESVSMTARGDNGVATFPAIVSVDNSEGLLMSNMNVSYRFVSSESSDCLVVPIQAVKYVSLSGNADDLAMLPDSFGDDMQPDSIPVDGDVSEDFYISDDTSSDDSGDIALPQSYGGGAVAVPLGTVAIMEGSMDISGSSSGGAYYATPDDGTATIVFVRAETPPEAALEADPAWNCPEGFYPVRVEVGLADSTNVEIISGLNEGDEVFIGYETMNANSYGY